MPQTRTIRTPAPTGLLAATLMAVSLAAVTLPAAHAAPAAEPAAATMSHRHILERINHHLAALKHHLAITPDEQTAWHAFAQMSRDNATGMEHLYRQRVQHLATMNAVENMDSFAAIEAHRADDMNKLSAAFQTLYSKLNPAQQHKLDAMFRRRAEHRLQHHHHMVKHPATKND